MVNDFIKKFDKRANAYCNVCLYKEVPQSKIATKRSFEIIANVFENDDKETLSQNDFACLGILRSTDLEAPYYWKYWSDSRSDFYPLRVYAYACFLDVSNPHSCLSDGLMFVPIYKAENDYINDNPNFKQSSKYPILNATCDCIGAIYSDDSPRCEFLPTERAKVIAQILQQYDISTASEFEKKIIKNVYDNTFLMLYETTFLRGQKGVRKNFQAGAGCDIESQYVSSNPVKEYVDVFRHRQRQSLSLLDYIEFCEKKMGITPQSNMENPTKSESDKQGFGIVDVVKNRKEERKEKRMLKNFKI